MNNRDPVRVLTGIAVLLTCSCVSLTREDIGELARDFPKHDSFRYVAHDTIPESWFEAAENTLDDPSLYIVLSDTGSPASRIIGSFTRAAYNHVSLAFDRNLETLVSYNGGGGVYNPGLNREDIAELYRRPGSSLAVFTLQASAAQKASIIQRIGEINRQGSSYNLLGLVLKRSFRENIMFCSQFVYTMLEHGELQYFDKKNEKVKPMDFIELDECRSLGFLYALGTEPEVLSLVRLSSSTP
jgi:hypothetical protein